MKIYKIPVEWEKFGTLEIEAENLRDAIEKAAEIEENIQNGNGIGSSVPLGNTVDVIKSFKIVKRDEDEGYFYKDNLNYYKKLNNEE